MGSIRRRDDNGLLFFDFRHKGKRCREQTTLDDTPANHKRLQKVLSTIEAEIKLGTFDYAKFFPGSKNIAKFATGVPLPPAPIAASVAQAIGGAPASERPTFNTFADTWVAENEVTWRRSHRRTVMDIVQQRSATSQSLCSREGASICSTTRPNK